MPIKPIKSECLPILTFMIVKCVATVGSDGVSRTNIKLYHIHPQRKDQLTGD